MNDLEIFINAPEDATAEELADYIDRACGPDQTLRERVKGLFDVQSGPEQFMEHTSLPGVEVELIEPESAGTVIGNYKLLQKIGEGGFGVVYMADQLAPVKRL
ncbi:MAG: hypothetical protein ACI9R3_000546 [Verrucomicrobiales bacterium]|jgi:hypothetical protein